MWKQIERCQKRKFALLQCHLEALQPHCTTTFPVIFGWTEQK
jgi:hypothetical protein